MALREWGHSTSAELARDICHDAGSLTRILDELEQRDLIARARSETDRRVVTLSTDVAGTCSGREAAAACGGTFWNTLLGDFSHLEIKLLVKLLTRLAAATEGKRDESGPRPRKRQEKQAGPVVRYKENRKNRHLRGQYP